MDLLHYLTQTSFCMDALHFLHNLYSIAQPILHQYSLHYCFLHDHPTVHLPSTLTPFYMDVLLSVLSPFYMCNILYALSAFYMDSLYFTFTLRITAVLYIQPKLHIPSAKSTCYMTSLMVEYQIAFKIKSSRAVS